MNHNLKIFIGQLAVHAYAYKINTNSRVRAGRENNRPLVIKYSYSRFLKKSVKSYTDCNPPPKKKI